MLSFTQRGNLYGVYTTDTSVNNLAFGDTLMNNKERQLLAKKPWWFQQRTASVTSVTSQQFYNLPFDIRKLNKISTVVGNTRYVPTEVSSRQEWDNINSSTSTTSNTPERWFVFDDQFGIYPTPSGTSQTHTLTYEKKFKDLTLADYTTGTIVSIANGATTVVGTGTTWTDKFPKRFIRITDSDNENTGDGVWYEIESITNTTTLELKKAYNGPTIAAATAAYAIGQMTAIPEEYHEIPVLQAAAQYWMSQNKQLDRANTFKQEAFDLIVQMEEDQGSRTSGSVIFTDVLIKNPNLFVEI